jgi:serine/threonine-protein kinase
MSSTKGWLGQELAHGRYRVLDKLGEGGMGLVYRARDRNLGADVVIKTPKLTHPDDDRAVQRFLREVRSLVALVHPHVVRILDVGEHEGSPFAVMELLTGGSLKTRQPLPHPPEALRDWLPDVAAALDYVHGKGCVHRDVKPDNILFDDQGNAHLSDFGLVKGLAALTVATSSSLTESGMLLGTPGYMAPEALLGQPCDGRTDQYSLAITVYEALTGRRLFEGVSPIEIAVRQIDKPGELTLPNIAPGLCPPLQTALALDREHRHPSCEVFARAVLAGVLRPAAVAVPRPAGRPGEVTAPFVSPLHPGLRETPNTPTTLVEQRHPRQPLPPSPVEPYPQEGVGEGRHLLWALVALGGVVFLGVVLLIVLFMRGPGNRKTTEPRGQSESTQTLAARPGLSLPVVGRNCPFPV